MSTTVRLDDEDEEILESLAVDYGSRSLAVHHALRQLAARKERERVLESLLADWEAEDGPVDPDLVTTMTQRYKLDS